MTCERIRPLLSSYHDDALSLEDRARVRIHVAACPDCGAVLAAYDDIFAALRDVVTPVPPDLRRNVYARIAEVEARRVGGLPFGSALVGVLRTAGGTAGLLAVLAAIVAAVVHFDSLPARPAMQLAGHAPLPHTSRASAPMAPTLAEFGARSSAGVAGVPALPAPVQTAVASLRPALARGAVVQLTGVQRGRQGTTYSAELVRRAASGAPKAVVPLRIKAPVPIDRRASAVPSLRLGTPQPVPTISPNAGFVYAHLTSPAAFLPNGGNSQWDGIEWHGIAPGGAPRVVTTPASGDQLVTGVNGSLDGSSAVYSAMSQLPGLGGTFALSARSRPRLMLSLQDQAPPNVGPSHIFIQQAYPTARGRWLFAEVDGPVARVVMTTTRGDGYRLVARIALPPVDFVVAPDLTQIAWTHDPGGDLYGTLQVAALGTHPLTRTIAALAYHPVWSPDSRSILFLHRARRGAPAALWVWSSRDRRARLLVPGSRSHQPFISGFTWAPGGRYFAYVLTTTGGPHAGSQVRLGDVQTGLTWPSFQRRWIGSIAWVRGPLAAASPARHGGLGRATAVAVATARPRAVSTTTAAVNPPGVPVGSQPIAPVQQRSRAVAAPMVFDSTRTPADVLLSFYNAINRHDFRRAYSYLADDDHRTVRQFAAGYADTRSDTILKLVPAPYASAANYHAQTCLGLQLLAHHKNGTTVDYGGWYMVQSTSAQNPRFTGWRILMGGTHMKKGGALVVPPQARCVPRKKPAGSASQL